MALKLPHPGSLVAFAINLAHWADIGGAVPGSYVPWAREACQEGLRIAPIRVATPCPRFSRR